MITHLISWICSNTYTISILLYNLNGVYIIQITTYKTDRLVCKFWLSGFIRKIL